MGILPLRIFPTPGRMLYHNFLQNGQYCTAARTR